MIVSPSPGRSTLHLYIGMIFNDWQIWHWQVHLPLLGVLLSQLCICVFG